MEYKLNWIEIKQRAKEISSRNKWNIWKPILFILLASACIGGIVGGLIYRGQEITSGISGILLGACVMPLEIGLLRYFQAVVRGEKPTLDFLKDYYSDFKNIFLISILSSCIVYLATLAFVIPGIIFSIAYSLIPFIYIRNKDLDVKEYLVKSRAMMYGYKLESFLFVLSFIGWELLVIITLGIATIWVTPYEICAITMFYDEIMRREEGKLVGAKKRAESVNHDDSFNTKTNTDMNNSYSESNSNNTNVIEGEFVAKDEVASENNNTDAFENAVNADNISSENNTENSNF